MFETAAFRKYKTLVVLHISAGLWTLENHELPRLGKLAERADCIEH
ncbi:MAG: hypothetical protein KAW12_02335 [Candidatus Aminicenantes bacterium]|nr:hypothetical protein [Candidatus Aminicenantes bacterium]